MKKIFYILLIIILISTNTYAHKGRTDGAGGHYNRSTGEYHYHHGYPPHDHINGVCPYSYKDTTNSSTSNSKEIVIEKDKNESLTLDQIIAYIILFILLGLPWLFSILYAIVIFLFAILSPLFEWLKNKFNKK